MTRLLLIFLGLLITGCAHPMYDAYPEYYDGYSENDACCPPDEECECWCLCVDYKPCYYYTQRCIEEQVPCKKICCRYVPQFYEVEKCRYIPECYTEQLVRYEPEYYEVPDCQTCQKWICEEHCTYTPCYYWKHDSCGQTQYYECN